jgi:hypothetical protein
MYSFHSRVRDQKHVIFMESVCARCVFHTMILAAATEFWGPCGWKFLHSVAATYDPQQSRGNDAAVRKHYATFFNMLEFILPCHLCRSHYRLMLLKRPVEQHLQDALTLQRWVYDAHDDVNRANGKTSPPFDTVLQMYNVVDRTKPLTMDSLACPLFKSPSKEPAIATTTGAASEPPRVPAAVVLGAVAIGATLLYVYRHRIYPPQKLPVVVAYAASHA